MMKILIKTQPYRLAVHRYDVVELQVHRNVASGEITEAMELLHKP